MELYPNMEAIDQFGFNSTSQPRFVYVRRTGENNPVYSDATLKSVFGDYLLQEGRSDLFALFLEDREGDLPGLHPLEPYGLD